MRRRLLPGASVALVLGLTGPAAAVSSAELYQNESYTYGRFEARIRFAPGDGVVSSFFLWKPGSEVAGTFWNELDFEKLNADCRMQTNPLYGNPVEDYGEIEAVTGDLCGEYHTYTFDWTPSYIAWLIDGVEVRREGAEVAEAFAQNAATGMEIHFNVWPGDETFGGNFDAAILPVEQYISWVQYSSFEGGAFTFEWREDFSSGALPSGWVLGNWDSPKGYSTHAPNNVNFTSDIAILSLTADDATGFGGEPPADEATGPGSPDVPGNPDVPGSPDVPGNPDAPDASSGSPSDAGGGAAGSEGLPSAGQGGASSTSDETAGAPGSPSAAGGGAAGSERLPSAGQGGASSTSDETAGSAPSVGTSEDGAPIPAAAGAPRAADSGGCSLGAGASTSANSTSAQLSAGLLLLAGLFARRRARRDASC